MVASSFYPWAKIKTKLKRGEVKDLLHYWLLSVNRCFFRKRFLKKIHDVVHAFPYDECDTIVKYPPAYGESEIIPKELIEGSIDVPFEHIIVKIQKNYDAILRRYFGDYMQLPLEEERQSHHLIAYVNMDARETFEEVKRKLYD